jgi:glycosyltransferase involved in cell wall biosynthesis
VSLIASRLRLGRTSGLKIAVAGHFAHGTIGADGQIARSRTVRDELIRALGVSAVRSVDTGLPGMRGLFRIELNLWRALKNADSLVALPGVRAVRYLLPQYIAWHKLTRCPVHLIAIGGFLPRLTAKSSSLRRNLQACECVYVQTERILAELEACGLRNAVVFRNFRRFQTALGVRVPMPGPLRAVFFSRLIPEKGLETAIRAVIEANASRPNTCTLDIYGPLRQVDAPWYRSVESTFTADIRYQGVVPPADVLDRLQRYDVMLFPTVFPDEGFPGVLLEAMSAGLALLASDWMSNSEIVHDGCNGFVLPPNDVKAFSDKLIQLAEDRSLLLAMQRHAAHDALQCQPDAVMPVLLSRVLAASTHSDDG